MELNLLTNIIRPKLGKSFTYRSERVITKEFSKKFNTNKSGDTFLSFAEDTFLSFVGILNLSFNTLYSEHGMSFTIDPEQSQILRDFHGLDLTHVRLTINDTIEFIKEYKVMFNIPALVVWSPRGNADRIYLPTDEEKEFYIKNKDNDIYRYKKAKELFNL